MPRHPRLLLLSTLTALLLCAPASYASRLSECLGFSPKDRVLIVDAADVGLQPDIDAAAFALVDQGLIQTLSVIPTGPDFDNVARMARERGLPVGLELTLTNEWQDKLPWTTVLPRDQVPSLYADATHLWSDTEQLGVHAERGDVLREMLAQIGKARGAGLQISHIQSHRMFWRANPEIMKLYLTLPAETGIPLVAQMYELPFERQMARNLTGQQVGVITPDATVMLYDPARRVVDQRYTGYDELLPLLPPGITHLTIHPAQPNPKARTVLPDQAMRVSDYNLWREGRLQKTARQLGIKTTDFAPLKLLQRRVDDSTDSCIAVQSAK